MSYERYESQRRRQGFGANSRRTTLGYWIPLAITVTVATVGLAAWVWKERSEDGEGDDRDDDDRPSPGYRNEGNDSATFARAAQQPSQDDPGLVSRMSGALRRTPSPQQFFDEAGRRVAAGVAAAGAAVGGALTSIREEGGRGDYEDHSRWSEEAVARASGPGPLRPIAGNITSGAKERLKKVAIVISADIQLTASGHEEATYLQEHASILSHLPEHIDDDVRVFVMIYAPDIQQHPLSKAPTTRFAASETSSYSNIGHEDLQTPVEDSEKTFLNESQPATNPGSRMFNALYSQAQTLVDRDTMIMPFTTPSGYISLLRHVNPAIVYLQTTLSGNNGEAVKEVARRTGQVVLVVGDDSGHGGLVDSEDERGAHTNDKSEWWKSDAGVGLGKGIEVVEGLRVGEDWRRRVKGHD